MLISPKTNKIIIALIWGISFSCSTDSQTKSNKFVYDHENILTDLQEKEMQIFLEDLHDKTSRQIVLVTASDYDGSASILDFTIDFSLKAEIDSTGVIIAFSKKNRETRISTGYESEKIVRDEIAKQIMDSVMIPNFKTEEYFKGLMGASQAVANIFLTTADSLQTSR